MSVVYLERMFRPRSVAVIGANNRPQRVGGVVMRNLLSGGFEGPIMPVNPRYEAVAGVLTYPDVTSLPRTPDLAILCTPPETVPDLLDELGARGTRAAVVVARGLASARDAGGRSLEDRMLAAAKAHGIRLLGGSTLGLLVPRIGLNASFSRVKALPGDIGFVSQSDAVGTLVLDWAHPRRVGFSHFISLGDASDIGFGEALDYLGSDPDTRAILLYIESLRERRSFMAAARGAARNKPVVAIKAGRRPPGGAAAPLSADTLSLVDPDDVFEAALRRAGILRVRDIEELFGAVETLARARAGRGERLAVVSNGGGAGVMAADELYSGGLALAPLSPATAARLRPAVPAGWDGQNPIDIQVDAPGSRYAEVLRILIESREFDSILAIHTPSTLASSTEAARAVIETAAHQPVNVLTCWIGGETLAAARKILVDAGLATFDTPADAARAFRFTVAYERAHEALIQTPPSAPVEFRPDPEAARRTIRRVLEEGRDYLRAPERAAVLGAYGIPVVDTHIADTPEQAARVAAAIGFPVELAIRSPDIRRKREVGGVALSLETAAAVEAAARNLISHLTVWRPDARLTGFTVQRMLPRPRARQLFAGMAVDPLFGPVILFGEGRASERSGDFSVSLPPLNLLLARNLVSRTRVSRLLEASPSRPAADVDAVCLTLMKVSQLAVDQPEIVEMDINPLLADETGVVASGSFMRVARAGAAEDRLAIRPYPEWLEERARLPGGREVVLRPIRPEDEPGHNEFVNRLSPEDSRFRFFHYVRSLPHSELARLTQIDYDREMAFVAVAPGEGGREETLGVVRSVADPDNDTAEFSVVVRSDVKRQGIASLLLRKMLDYARSRGTRALSGDVLADNLAMLELARRHGAAAETSAEEGVVRVVFRLQEPAGGGPGAGPPGRALPPVD
jgi:acetyltransferase